MTFSPHTHWTHKYVVAEAWILDRVGSAYTVDLKLGRNEFVVVKTTQIDRLMQDFEINPLDMGD
jgi:hypothetical protein